MPILNVDHLKQLYDEHGYACGDEALISLVRTLSGNIRDIDTLGRISGEEFAVCMPETTIDEAARFAERLRQHIGSLRFESNNQMLSLTVSMGIASCDGGRETPDDCLRRTDQALYRAKESDRDRVVLASEET